MSCGNSSPVTAYTAQYFYNPNCTDCDENCGGNSLTSTCVFYTGPALSCSGIATDDSLETALQKIDTQICSAIGDYSTYQFNCLVDYWGSNITQESVFVDAITEYTCATQSSLTTFTDTTFPAYTTDTNNRLTDIEVPQITCTSASVTNTDTLSQVLTKYCTKFTSIDTAISLSGVTWNACFTASTPTSIAGAFSLLANQICQVKTLAETGALPVFNNYGSCIGGTSDDSLPDTIALIKTRLCSTPTFDINTLSWGCLTKPSTTTTDLQDAFQTVLSAVSTEKQKVTQYSADFILTPNDVSDPCQGQLISLATPINQDRFVAVNVSDSSPSTLINKIVGIGITVDDTSNPGQLTLTSSATSDTYEVKADSTDTSPDYLVNKVSGGTSTGVTIGTSYNSGTEQVDILPSIDLSTLFDALLDQLLSDSDLYTKFCTRVANCPSPCSAPTNVQVITDGTSTSTTTIAP